MLKSNHRSAIVRAKFAEQLILHVSGTQRIFVETKQSQLDGCARKILRAAERVLHQAEADLRHENCCVAYHCPNEH